MTPWLSCIDYVNELLHKISITLCFFNKRNTEVLFIDLFQCSESNSAAVHSTRSYCKNYGWCLHATYDSRQNKIWGKLISPESLPLILFFAPTLFMVHLKWVLMKWTLSTICYVRKNELFEKYMMPRLIFFHFCVVVSFPKKDSILVRKA